MKTAMGIGCIVRFVDIDLFYVGFHVEIFIEDDRVQSKPVADVGSGITCKRGLSLWYSVHPIVETRPGVAVGAVPHTLVKGGTCCRIEILSVAN
uniref:Uncharacterized protein n=1 Tax=Romanomermis culicivorax TaxID=13658 RepID=A0A915J5T7_ROMCU